MSMLEQMKHKIWIVYERGPAKNKIRFIPLLIHVVLSQNMSDSFQISLERPNALIIYSLQSKFYLNSYLASRT